MNYTILITDDEQNIRDGLAEFLEGEGYKTKQAGDGMHALSILEKGMVDLVITDLRMPILAGGKLLQEITKRYAGLPCIVLTGHGTVEDAVNAMRDGAVDFLTKPVSLDHLAIVIKKALYTRELATQNTELKKELTSKQTMHKLKGNSPALQKIQTLIERAAPTKANVLITGESGVGKELVAEALHTMSPRHDKPLIKVHCAALAESILESELFGHEKGAFTGAVARKRGRFELADGGTIFLDEIGEINLNLQVKILRVLQDKKFERVGGEETIETDVRIIAATNRNLQKEISEGRFREDLYYRLNVVNIQVPPLRERREDIPLLSTAFLREFAEENGKKIEGFDTAVRNALLNWQWPGNIRELRNSIESAVVMARGSLITMEDLPPNIVPVTQHDITIPADTSLATAEKLLIAHTLATHNNNKSKVAEILGIGRKTLYQKIEEYGLGDTSKE